MPFVDARVIAKRMAVKDRRMNAALRRGLTQWIDNDSCSTIGGNRDGVSSTIPAPDSESHASKEDADMPEAVRDSIPHDLPAIDNLVAPCPQAGE